MTGGDGSKRDGAPQAGRLESLGPEQDRADALAIIGVVQSWDDRPRRLVRYALTYGFEYPRYPRPLLLRGVKLPASWPWSPDARAEAGRAASEGRPDRPAGLVQEHVRPIGDVAAAVVERPELHDPDTLVPFLYQQLSGYAVITKTEDDRLAAADRAAKAAGIDYTADPDPWARYRAAGFDVAHFAPLDTVARPRRTARITTQRAEHGPAYGSGVGGVDIEGLGPVSESELAGYLEWLMTTRGVTRKVASDYRSRLRRALVVDVATLRPNVQADIRTAIRAFEEYRAGTGPPRIERGIGFAAPPSP